MVIMGGKARKDIERERKTKTGKRGRRITSNVSNHPHGSILAFSRTLSIPQHGSASVFLFWVGFLD